MSVVSFCLSSMGGYGDDRYYAELNASCELLSVQHGRLLMYIVIVGLF